MEEITNNEVTDVAETMVEEIEVGSPNENLKMAAVGGLAVLVSGLAIQYVVVPVVSKVKAWRKKKKGTDEDIPAFDTEFTEVTDSDDAE